MIDVIDVIGTFEFGAKAVGLVLNDVDAPRLRWIWWWRDLVRRELGLRKVALCRTPLCPAGHLPRKGGDRPSSTASPILNVAERAAAPKLPISPLAGEMSGRTEGGATEREVCVLRRSVKCLDKSARRWAIRNVAYSSSRVKFLPTSR